MGAGPRHPDCAAAGAGAGAAARAEQAAGTHDAGEQEEQGGLWRGGRAGGQRELPPFSRTQNIITPWYKSNICCAQPTIPTQALSEALEESEARGTISTAQHHQLMAELAAKLQPLLLHPS